MSRADLRVPPNQEKEFSGWTDRARRDAMKHIARDIPDPAEYARYLPLDAVEALMSARFHQHDTSWRVDAMIAPSLRKYGLVDAGTGKRCLTAFGIGVMKALQEMDG